MGRDGTVRLRFIEAGTLHDIDDLEAAFATLFSFWAIAMPMPTPSDLGKSKLLAKQHCRTINIDRISQRHVPEASCRVLYQIS